MFSVWTLLVILGLAACVLLYWYRAVNRETLWVKQSSLSGLHRKGHERTDQLTGEKDVQPEKVAPARQPWEYFLVLDVEATCVAGTDFNWPNEIIVRRLTLFFLWNRSPNSGRNGLLCF
jgi:hypothetical protein